MERRLSRYIAAGTVIAAGIAGISGCSRRGSDKPVTVTTENFFNERGIDCHQFLEKTVTGDSIDKAILAGQAPKPGMAGRSVLYSEAMVVPLATSRAYIGKHAAAITNLACRQFLKPGNFVNDPTQITSVDIALGCQIISTIPNVCNVEVQQWLYHGTTELEQLPPLGIVQEPDR